MISSLRRSASSIAALRLATTNHGFIMAAKPRAIPLRHAATTTAAVPKGRPPSPRVPPRPLEGKKKPPIKLQGPVMKTSAGTGRAGSQGIGQYAENKSPVSWMTLFVVGVASAAAVAYFRIERERRLERALGKVVTSEFDDTNKKNPQKDGFAPTPLFAKREFVPTPYGWFPKDDGWGPAGKPAIGGPWSLLDLEGRLVTEQSFVGKWTMLYFGFARCPDICPSEMNKVAQVLDTLKKTHPHLYEKLVPVFVSVDPARDSLQALRSFAKDFHPDYIFLTGTPQQVAQMAKTYRVYVSKAEEQEDDYLVDHSIVIYFHEPSGELSDCFTQSMRASDVVEKVIEKMTYVPKPI